MILANFNIKQTPPMLRSSVLHDLRIAKHTSADIINWQELVKYKYYKMALRAVFPKRHGWEHLFMQRRTATTYNTHQYRLINKKSIRLTNGTRKLPQPPRFTNIAIFRDVNTREAFADVNSQWSNGGYNGRWRPKWNREERKRRNDREYDVTKRKVNELVTQGYPVFGSGDYNRHDMPKFHPDQIWIYNEPGDVMKMWFIPGTKAQKLHLKGKTKIPDNHLKTDHTGLVVEAEIGR